MKAYLTHCYLIKWGNVGLLKNAFCEIAIILPTPAAKKLKYARKMPNPYPRHYYSQSNTLKRLYYQCINKSLRLITHFL